MPATYTYNDGIDDAKAAVVRAWEAESDPEKYMKIMLDIVGRLEKLRRPNRRKRPRRDRATAVSEETNGR